MAIHNGYFSRIFLRHNICHSCTNSLALECVRSIDYHRSKTWIMVWQWAMVLTGHTRTHTQVTAAAYNKSHCNLVSFSFGIAIYRWNLFRSGLTMHNCIPKAYTLFALMPMNGWRQIDFTKWIGDRVMTLKNGYFHFTLTEMRNAIHVRVTKSLAFSYCNLVIVLKTNFFR